MSFQDTIRTCAPVRLPSAPVARQQELKGRSGRPTRFTSALWEPHRHRPSSNHPLHRTRLKRLPTTTRRQPVKLLPCHSVCIFDLIWFDLIWPSITSGVSCFDINQALTSRLCFPIGRPPFVIMQAEPAIWTEPTSLRWLPCKRTCTPYWVTPNRRPPGNPGAPTILPMPIIVTCRPVNR